VNSVTFYVLSGSIDGLPISLTGDDAGWFLRAPVITVKLICKPFGYGTPVTSSTASSATPFVTMTIAAQAGDVPAEGRLLVTDAATQNRRYVEWGLQQRYYDSLTSLMVESDDLVTSGYSGFQTTRTGAYDVGGGNTVVRGTLIGSPTAICASGTLSHVGSYRVKARVYASVATEYIRFSWQEGDGPYRANSYVTPPVGGTFSEVDLGLVSVPSKTLGTQRWQGRVEAYTSGTPGTDTLDVDYLVLIPADEGYGRARGEVTPDTPTVPSARDEFNQTSGALVGKTAPIGGVWAGVGDTDDFSVDSTTATLQRTIAAIDTGNGRFDTLPTSMTTAAVRCDVMSTNDTNIFKLGVVTRLVDVNNWFRAFLNVFDNQFIVQKNIAGTPTVLWTTTDSTLSANQWYTISLVVDAAGRWWAGYAPRGAQLIFTARGIDTTLATGGVLASGNPGVTEQSNTSAAGTRSWDNFAAWVPTIPTVIYSGRVAEVRSDGAIRQDSTGIYYGPVPAYRGSRFLVPAAGDENRTSRIFVKAHRSDIEFESSDNVTDNLTIQTIVTPRYVVVPF
jgi:hypothetical protein